MPIRKDRWRQRLDDLARLGTALVLLMVVLPCARAQEQPEPLKLGGMVTTGSLEFGLRQALLGGNQDVYRSQVNLGSGIRLWDVFIESRSPENTGPLYDYFTYSMRSWGGDPYNTIRLRMERHRRYRFDFHYWRMDYVNLLPTFANPLLGEGVIINQHSFQQSRRTQSYRLTLFPDTGHQIRFGYDRNYAFGQALTTFTLGLDEFVLHDPIRTTTNDYHLGIDLRLKKINLTVEQDFRSFKDDIATFQPEGLVNTGNNPQPGPVGAAEPQQMQLTSFRRNDGVRGFTPATRLALHSHLSEQLSVTGRFIYSDGDVDFNRDEILSGTLFDLQALRFIRRQSTAVVSHASKPHTRADVSVRYEPTRRLQITNSLHFTHFVIASGSLARTLEILGMDLQGNPPSPEEVERMLTSLLNERIFLNSFRNRLEVSYDLLPSLVLRGGYRFTRRRAVLHLPVPVRGGEESVLRTHTGMAGLSWRLARRIRLFTRFERGSADNVFTRVAPYHVTRFHLRSTVQPTDKWQLSTQYLLNDSRNPNPFVDNVQRNRIFNISSSWFPHPRFGLDVGYTRSDISSVTDIVNPRTMETGRSVYIANDNVVDADLNVSPFAAFRMSIGYSLINSQGTFPLNYHQPRAEVRYTFPRRFTWIVTWQWYGYNEKGRALQDYRGHLLTSRLRIAF
ncbi:MAG: hypothetical protein D6723_18470 [Acidobacteria bacterium]|nr:MAG: hypothetical protein D6723_18470 [Acidobacteriota bacterium]